MSAMPMNWCDGRSILPIVLMRRVQQSIHAALVARVQDTSAIVLGALYADASSILPVFLGDSKAYLDHLSVAILGSKPKRQILRSHLVFLATHFCPAAT